MRFKKTIKKSDQGVIITLVAMFMLFIVGAMAALSIDVVTFYTARSEAQLAADSGALAAARALANSGMTSDLTAIGDGIASSAETTATTVAMQVASSNYVGGRPLVAGGACPATEICIKFNDSDSSFVTNPHVTVQVQRTDLPTFFGRIWGSTHVTVTASATAEAYNPSGGAAFSTNGTPVPVAPMCVKPWLLPNLDPSSSSGLTEIFNTATGAIQPTATQLQGYTTTTAVNPLKLACGAAGTAHPADCSASSVPVPVAWQYYPGDPTSFPAPTQALPACTLTTDYEKSVAGCIQTPISCNSQVNVQTTQYLTRPAETADAVNCLTHSAGNSGDKVDLTPPGPPFQFIAGEDNPVPGLAGNNVMVSDSLVTLPVIDTTGDVLPANPVQIVGFIQVFLSPRGRTTPISGHMATTVINLAGCGSSSSTGATPQQPILGNGASPVVVRLITPP